MKISDILFAVLVAVLWGGNFVAAKFGMTHFPPFYLSALRFALVASLVIPFVRRPSPQEMWWVISLSLVLGTLHFSFAISGMYYGLDIATSIITIQLGIPFSCAIGAIFLNDRLGRWRTMGMIIAFAGVVIVAGTPRVSDNYIGFMMVLFAALTFGMANVIMKIMPPIPIMSVIGWMSLFSVPQIMLLSLLIEENHILLLQTITWEAVFSVAYSAIGSSIIAYSLWYYLLQKYDVSQVVPFALLAPFFGITFGWIFFGEELGIKTLTGGLVTLIGVGIITIRRPRVVPMGEGAG